MKAVLVCDADEEGLVGVVFAVVVVAPPLAFDAEGVAPPPPRLLLLD